MGLNTPLLYRMYSYIMLLYIIPYLAYEVGHCGPVVHPAAHKPLSNDSMGHGNHILRIPAVCVVHQNNIINAYPGKDIKT